MTELTEQEQNDIERLVNESLKDNQRGHIIYKFKYTLNIYMTYITIYKLFDFEEIAKLHKISISIYPVNESLIKIEFSKL